MIKEFIIQYVKDNYPEFTTCYFNDYSLILKKDYRYLFIPIDGLGLDTSWVIDNKYTKLNISDPNFITKLKEQLSNTY